MMTITCPWCGKRRENEFTYGGPVPLARPDGAREISDKAWAEYLFMRDNIKGIARERWCHSHGCGQWFTMRRDTVTHKIHSIEKTGDAGEP